MPEETIVAPSSQKLEQQRQLDLQISASVPDSSEAQAQKKIYALLGEAAEPQEPAPEAPQEQPPPPPETPEPEESQDHPEAEAPEHAPEASEEMVEVDFEGRRYQVPREIQRGLLREKDYYAKTQELAEMRRATTAQAQALDAQRLQYEQGLAQAQSLLESRLSAFGQVDWDKLRETDSQRYLVAKEQEREIRDGYTRVLAQRQALADEQARQAITAFRTYQEQQYGIVQERVPEWREDSKRAQEQRDIALYLMGMGYTDKELAPQYNERGHLVSTGLADARALLLARKAMLYDRGHVAPQAAKLVAKRVENLPRRVAQPGNAEPQPTRESDALARLKRSGSERDAFDAIYARLGGSDR
jgi:hypothetical protein